LRITDIIHDIRNFPVVRFQEVYPIITVKVGRRGQITLPSTIRRKIGLKEGDHIAVLTQGEQLILRPITRTLLDLRGSVPVTAPQDFTAIRQQVIEAQVEKVVPHGS
jgi:antitoxin PrlF